ncbi:MAG: AlpA family phage regulatory protein [Cellulophaga sp.]
MQSPFPDNLEEIADSMGIALYQRFTLNEGALFLRCSVSDITKLQKQGKIEYIKLINGSTDFFGYQLLQFLLNSISGNTPKITEQSLPERILRTKEVQDMTSLSRTTIWRLERKGEFPNRVALSSGSIGWRATEIEKWIRER